MHCVSSSSSLSIRTRDQLNGETLTGKSSHWKVKQINRVGCFWIDKHNRRCNSSDHSDKTRHPRDYYSKFAEETHTRQFKFPYIDSIDMQNAPNRQQRTFLLPNFTKTPGIATSCQDLFRLRFLGMLGQTSCYGGHSNHYTASWHCRHPAPLPSCARGSTHWQWMQLRNNCCQEIKLAEHWTGGHQRTN